MLNNNDTLVSVILPFFNAGKDLEIAIQSIVSRTFINWELLLIDNGTNDISLSIAKEYASTDKRILYYRLAKPNLVEALNFGIKKSSGKYLARMDAEDISLPNRLALQYQYLEKHPECALVSCLVSFGGDQKKAEGYKVYVDWLNSILTPEEIKANRFVESPIAHPSILMRKITALNAGLYREGNFPEDYEFWLRIMANNEQIHKIGEYLLIWNDPPDRLSRIAKKYSKSAFYRIKSQYLYDFLQSVNIHHPDIWILGGSKIIRKRSEYLSSAGLTIKNYADINPGRYGMKVNGIEVVPFEDIPSPDEAFIVSMVGGRNKSAEIREAMDSKGYTEYENFILAS